MHNVMVDIETLDTTPTASILSIAAVRFNPDGPVGDMEETFHYHVDIDSNLALGRTISGSTLMWWLDQDFEAREAVITASRYPLLDVLKKLGEFINEKDRVWGNGAAFDNVILTHAFKACEIPVPWRFWSDMCFRTMKEMFRDSVPKPEFVGTKHNALCDAVHQATHLQLIFEHIKQKQQSEV